MYESGHGRHCFNFVGVLVRRTVGPPIEYVFFYAPAATGELGIWARSVGVVAVIKSAAGCRQARQSEIEVHCSAMPLADADLTLNPKP